MQKDQKDQTNRRFENKRSFATVVVGFNIHLFHYDWQIDNSYALVRPISFQSEFT